MLDRRTWLKRSGLVALSPTVPLFLARSAAAAADKGSDGRKLVILQMDGGNDGVNTVVPYADEGYAEHRKHLRLAKDSLIKIDDHVALHPAMRSAGDLLHQQSLAIVQGVGYPNPDRSHFRSMAIWQTARMDDAEHNSYGWVGRALDGASRSGDADSVFIGARQPPLALRGRRSVAASMLNANDLTLQLPLARPKHDVIDPPNDVAAFAQRAVTDAYLLSAQLDAAAHKSVTAVGYPASSLARRMKVIAQLIKADLPASVYYTIQGGYDTHAGQLQRHFALLGTFATALKAFFDDLQAAGLHDRVVVLAFSEFGRRVDENGSHGTDHGTAGPVFLAGSRIKAGLHGRTPSMIDLSDGDLKTHVDFRSIYADLITNWLRLPTGSSVGPEFQPSVSLIRS